MKNAIITGVGRYNGIGAEICRMLSSKGYGLFITSYREYDEKCAGIDENDIDKLLKDCKNTTAIFRDYDLGFEKEIFSLFDEANKELGEIDVLVNCMCHFVDDSLSNLSEELLLTSARVNTIGPALLCREFIRRYKGDCGRIVLFSSTQELEPSINQMSYVFTKASVPIIVKNLAIYAADKNTTINAINPGFTDTGIMDEEIAKRYIQKNPFHRIGTVKDAANIVEFLISTESSWITGQTINSEGGLYREV